MSQSYLKSPPKNELANKDWKNNPLFLWCDRRRWIKTNLFFFFACAPWWFHWVLPDDDSLKLEHHEAGKKTPVVILRGLSYLWTSTLRQIGAVKSAQHPAECWECVEWLSVLGGADIHHSSYNSLPSVHSCCCCCSSAAAPLGRGEEILLTWFWPKGSNQSPVSRGPTRN